MKILSALVLLFAISTVHAADAATADGKLGGAFIISIFVFFIVRGIFRKVKGFFTSDRDKFNEELEQYKKSPFKKLLIALPLWLIIFIVVLATV